ncbi:hypothetical protein MHM84_01030 [Halomonas sp. McH1-25]|uniref:hypothetical protein n=1 Tax=unclassified Halomonas TaxID=2609666 RepID=UPI001EF74AFB|nr:MULTISPECIES: hypothetical protein [unclassified Halomonas]MCG7598365.1 hypothetical protein [Halomonas sp. McH1-25]MCP1342693.1 hypothetical protein [Halomonas sp. FL8]MCP1363093.1 hypothetical protein [Halomonas sp. BBD45]MCP1367071.1 hypothetical protein [Halomonas sp. BBD48]
MAKDNFGKKLLREKMMEARERCGFAEMNLDEIPDEGLEILEKEARKELEGKD